jgi:hypothetical protein
MIIYKLSRLLEKFISNQWKNYWFCFWKISDFLKITSENKVTIWKDIEEVNDLKNHKYVWKFKQVKLRFINNISKTSLSTSKNMKISLSVKLTKTILFEYFID